MRPYLPLLVFLQLLAAGPAAWCQVDPDASEPHRIELAGIAKSRDCQRSEVTFDGSAVRAICLTPEEVLRDMDAFWDQNDTFRLVRLWHRYRDMPYSIEAWKRRISEFTDIPPGERNEQPTFALYRRLMSRRDEFHRLAVPHVCSFLPHQGIDFNTIVHFAIGTDFSGFAADNFIVISISDPHWASDDSAILNSIVHEVFHIGYGWSSHLRTESPLSDRFLGDLVQRLHNEGMATYVAYKATPIFQASSEPDFSKLEDDAEVLASLDRLGELFRQAELQRTAECAEAQDPFGPAWMPEWFARLLGYEIRMSLEELRHELWRVGVEQRAYYVGGAYMAKTIDERLGRDALIATIVVGPRSFVRTYNSLVDERRRIHEFRSDEDQSIGWALKKAALSGDSDQFKSLLAKIRSDPPDDDRIQWYLWSTANVLRLQGYLDLAEETYRVVLQLNPESADAFDGLGLIHLQRGEKELALASFRESTRLEPHRPLAYRMTRELEQGSDD
jgi:tetratricopeptide (TPR) repeat protein